MTEWIMFVGSILITAVMAVVWVIEEWGDSPLAPSHKDVVVGVTCFLVIAVMNLVISADFLFGNGDLVEFARFTIRGSLLFAALYISARLWQYRRAKRHKG